MTDNDFPVEVEKVPKALASNLIFGTLLPPSREREEAFREQLALEVPEEEEGLLPFEDAPS